MKVYAAPEEIVVPEISITKIDEYQSACDAYLEAVQKWARENSTKHDLAGEVVTVPYADGHAVYVIAKIGSVCLIHIDTWDGWRDPDFERYATVAQLRDRVERARKRKSFAELAAAARARA